MPKLDDTHLTSRIAKRLGQLKRGEEVAAKDLRAVLTEEQIAELEAVWAAQQALRKQKRARTAAEQQALGWKSKREVQIEILQDALAAAKSAQAEVFRRKVQQTNVRQARNYFDSLNASEEVGITGQQARNRANNDLTRSGLRRMDGQSVGHASKRDREVAELEAELMKRIETEMTAEEREQQEMLRQSGPYKASPSPKSRRTREIR